jgi:transposase InsO family protein
MPTADVPEAPGRAKRKTTLEGIRYLKPTDNAFIEDFNGRFRAECLNAHWFQTLDDARSKMEDWRRYYNEEPPHRRSKEWERFDPTRDSAHRWMKERALVKKVC